MDPTFGTALLTLSLLGASPSARVQPRTAMTDAGSAPSLRAIIARDSRPLAHLVLPARQKGDPQRKKNWIQRHPSCFGAIVGFAGGFLIGFLPGDDAVFDDYVAAFNGAVLGGIGAGTGALLGWLGSRE